MECRVSGVECRGDRLRFARPLFACAALMLLAGHTLAEGPSSGPSTAPNSSAPSTAPSTQPAALIVDAGEPAVPKALVKAAKDSFVIIKTYFKKDTSETADAADDNWTTFRLYDEYVDKKRPALTTGIVIDADGRILTADHGLEDRFIDRIEIEAGGKTVAAKPDRLLQDAPAIILKPAAGSDAKFTPLNFSELKDEGVNTSLMEAELFQADDQWRLRFGSARPAIRFDGDASNVYFGQRLNMGFRNLQMSRGLSEYAARVTIVADKQGRPVGCCTTPFLDLRQEECLWKGPDLLKAEGMDWPSLTAAESACRNQLIGCVQEVVLVLRSGGGGDMEEPGPTPYRPSYGSEAAGREISVYGLAVSPTQVLIPRQLDSALARQIEKIYIKHSPSKRQPAKFVGAFKRIAAFMVSSEGGDLPAHAKLAKSDPNRMKPFWTARLRKRLGAKYVDLATNRIFGKEQGYEGKYHWYAARSINPGTLLVNFQGELLGAFVQERSEHEEERKLDEGRRYRGGDLSLRIFTISELRGMLAEPAKHLDAKIEVKTREMAKRRSWFGVEFVPVTAELSEMLKVEKPTKDGQLGFLVNAVYAGSPAEKMGMKVGDILLKLQAPGMPYPIELASRLAGGAYNRYGRHWGGYGGEDDEESMGPIEATWKNRMNFLTRALDAVGVGKVIEITYYRPEGEATGKGKTETIKYAIELAPPDLESAPRWQNRKLGMTVKDLTYEVRHALNLKDPAAGVIVAKVESGSPTLIAKIFPNEVVTQLNDQPLSSARQMHDLVSAAKKAGKDKVRLTILRLGKTRFADLAIGEYDPKDDEGLDEAAE